jgi:1-deoxy-D-xylulose-5-phosphate reductoisomerase
LVGEHSPVRKIIVTASGGSFRDTPAEELANVTVEQALKHPNWNMGAKITIDSSTLVNKAFEVIEARWLFNIRPEQIEVLIHPQSVVHSMVEFADGTVKAQIGASDMRIPIQCALSFPERWESPCERLDYTHEPAITFGEADERTFGCLALAKEAGHTGGTLPCVMNAANEVANEAFRNGACGFLDIERVVGEVMAAATAEPVETIRQLLDVDAAAREHARRLIEVISR